MGVKISGILRRVVWILKNHDFEAKFKGVSSVSGENLHDFENENPS